MNSALFIVTTTALFLICAVLTFNRVYRALPRGARLLAASGVCLTVAFFLLIPPIYTGMDSLMPAPNATDLVSHLIALTAVALLGAHVSSTAYTSELARKWTAAPAGVVALAVAALLEFGCFVFIDAPIPSPKLEAYTGQFSTQLYNWVGISYVGYVVFPLVMPALKDARINPLRLGRVASSLIAAGFALSALRPFTYPFETMDPQLVEEFQLISDFSVLSVVVGLALFRHCRLKRQVETQFHGSLLSVDTRKTQS